MYNLILKEFFKMHEKIMRNFSLFYKVLDYIVLVTLMELMILMQQAFFKKKIHLNKNKNILTMNMNFDISKLELLINVPI